MTSDTITRKIRLLEFMVENYDLGVARKMLQMLKDEAEEEGNSLEPWAKRLEKLNHSIMVAEIHKS